jgi:hypothetical protein
MDVLMDQLLNTASGGSTGLTVAAAIEAAAAAADQQHQNANSPMQTRNLSQEAAGPNNTQRTCQHPQTAHGYTLARWDCTAKNKMANTAAHTRSTPCWVGPC